MNRSGSVNRVEETNPPSRAVPWRVILLGIAALALALFIGTQVIGILYSIVAPPLPPLPESAKQLEHTSSDYGVDDWLYGVNQSACGVVRFYQEHDADCQITIDPCAGDTVTAARHRNRVAQCTSERKFSIFAVRWDVKITSGYTEDGITHFQLSREVFWSGSVPPRQQSLP